VPSLPELVAAIADGADVRVLSPLRKRWWALRHPHASVSFGRGTYVGPGFRLRAAPGATFRCGGAVEFRQGFQAEIGPGGRIEIGDGCRFTYGVVVQCSTSITFGARVIAAHAAHFVDGSHRFRDPSVPIAEQGYDFRPLAIGDDALVHAHCTVIHDVGERAVVGANAVVTRAVPPYTVALGVPARVVEELPRR